ncbi:MAG: SGNH/GDSL hydrolase family protein [Gammaproteobacteria bacterium]
MRKVTKATVSLTVIAVLSLLLLEGAVRVYSALYFPKMMVLDDTLGWRHASGREKTFINEYGESVLVRQNSYGFRGPERPRRSSSGSFRVLVLGDSFTEGVQVSEEQLFTAILETRMENTEVLNAGVGGYGTVQQYLLLETEGTSFEPDVVLLMFYENDLSDNCLSHSPGFGPRPYAQSAAGGIEIVRELVAERFQRFILPVPFALTLNKHSYLYNFLNNRIYQMIKADELRTLLQEDMKAAERCPQHLILAELLTRMREHAEAAHAAFVVALIPSQDSALAGRSEIDERVLTLCAERVIDCHSLLSAFSSVAGGAELYFPRDIHWTAAGHAQAAQELELVLSKRRP